MLELNKWFFVLLLNFLVLIYVLNIILFKPLVKLFTDRENTIKGALDAAREMSQKKEDSMAAMSRARCSRDRSTKSRCGSSRTARS